MTVIFNGKKAADSKNKKIEVRVNSLLHKNITPTLASIMIGDDASSSKYLKLKKAAAERVGCSLDIIHFKKGVDVAKVIERINDLNLDKNMHGVMVQLPLPDGYSVQERDTLINAINPSKDIDGMRSDSPCLAPVVMAVMQILLQLKSQGLPLHRGNPCKVVGAKGFVGKKLVSRLESMGYDVEGLDVDTNDLEKRTLEADVLISTTGVPGLIKQTMVKEGAILIDVGAPKGDIDKGAYEKATFISPVPGGIGPLTIYYLLSNLVDSAELA